jgi:3-deoxy-D-manno-octulosonic acid kinase
MSTNSERTIVLSTDRSTIYYDHCLVPSGDPNSWFDPSNPELQSEIVQAGGRAAAWYIQLGDQACVLRHYRRGGLAAKFLRNQYLWTGAAKSRAVTEFLLMRSLYDAGLSVPQPLAAGVWRSGLIYRAAIITARIKGVVPVSQVSAYPAWENAGRAIAKMHHAEIWHADLNVFMSNINRL